MTPADTLRVLIRLSRVDGELREAERQLAAVLGDVAEDSERWRLRGAHLQDTAGSVARRRALLGELPDDVALMYELLARAGRHPAVVPLADGYCSACHLRIPPQLAASVATAREIGRCPHCRRLLYDPRGQEARHA